jgi:hypothetical protein
MLLGFYTIITDFQAIPLMHILSLMKVYANLVINLIIFL